MSKFVLAAWLACACAFAGSAAAQSPGGALARIAAARQINVAVSADSPPFSSISAGTEPVGYSIELCKRVIEQIGKAVGQPQLKTNWIAAPVAERLQLVASGRADFDCANTTQTLARLASVDFSNLIFIDGGGLLVQAGAPINRIADLDRKAVAVLKGTTTQARLEEIVRARDLSVMVLPIDDGATGVTMVLAGSADAFAGDKVKLTALAIRAAEPARLALVAEDLSYEPYALALPRNDSAFRLEVNRALTQVYLSGEIERIYAQWLRPLGEPSGLLALMFLLNSIPP